jgi:hypothetical protein
MPRSTPHATLVVSLLLWPAAAAAQRASDTGTASMMATASGYVDITAGGSAVLVGSVGGSITANKVKGEPLTGLVVSLGEVGPVNRNAFVKVTVPVLLRSNIAYALAMSATPIAGNADAVGLGDLGFGLGNIRRTDPYVLPGTDTLLAAATGDPTLAPDAIPATPRWDYSSGARLADYVTAVGILSGPRILTPVPATVLSGLGLDVYFCIKPQFFAAGSFATTVTFTVSTP